MVQTPDTVMTVPAPVQTMTPEMHALIEHAASLGCVVQRRDGLVVDLGQQIACRLRPRTGSNVYQMPAFSISSFPRQMAEELCTGGGVTHDTRHCITWRWEEANWHHMHHFFSNLMAMQGRECAGQSKGLMTESEFVCRVIAKIIVPLEIS